MIRLSLRLIYNWYHYITTLGIHYSLYKRHHRPCNNTVFISNGFLISEIYKNKSQGPKPRADAEETKSNNRQLFSHQNRNGIIELCNVTTWPSLVPINISMFICHPLAFHVRNLVRKRFVSHITLDTNNSPPRIHACMLACTRVTFHKSHQTSIKPVDARVSFRSVSRVRNNNRLHWISHSLQGRRMGRGEIETFYRATAAPPPPGRVNAAVLPGRRRRASPF